MSITAIKTNFSDFRVNLVNHDVIKAVASCKVGDAVFLRGMRVMHGKNGRFVSMPARKTSQGEYQDIYFPASKEIRDQLCDTILEKYDEVINKS